MANRELRDGIRSSGPINRLSDRGFRLYANVLTAADDFGLVEWDETWLKANAVPLQPWDEQMMGEVMADLEKHHVVRLYEAKGKRYAAVEKWKQRQWAMKPKFPEPPWGFGEGSHITGNYADARVRARSSGQKQAPRVNGQSVEWTRSTDGLLKKAKELGIETRGESTDGLRRLCMDEIERRKTP
jgi:hypothetical protein